MDKENKYIGVIYWKDDPYEVLDNTTVSSFHNVLKQMCNSNPLHTGIMKLYNAKYIKDGEIHHSPIKEFSDIDDCKEYYKQQFNKEPLKKKRG